MRAKLPFGSLVVALQRCFPMMLLPSNAVARVLTLPLGL